MFDTETGPGTDTQDVGGVDDVAAVAAMDDSELDASIEQGTDLGEPKPAGAPKADTPKQDPTSEQRIAEIERRVQDQQAHIGKQSNEIGRLRAENERLRQSLPPLPQDSEKTAKFFENPLEETERLIEERERRKAEQQALEEGNRHQAMTRVLEVVPDLQELWPDMYRQALEDGIPEAELRDFAADPWKYPAEAVITMAKMARMRRELAQRTGAAAPTTQQRKAPRVLTGSMGRGGGPGISLDEEQIRAMSDEELDMHLKEMGGRGR